jgi:hypothetical protein
MSKSGLKLVCNVNIVHGNLKSESSQDYALKPQQNCNINEFGFSFPSSILTALQVIYVGIDRDRTELVQTIAYMYIEEAHIDRLASPVM